MTEKQTEALEKLNRGVQESRQEVQQRTMSLAQDYFGDSAEALKQQIKENRAALEGLPDQVPGGREEAFQTLFQELMDNYSAMEQCINEAREDVANLDTDQIRRQGEVEATDAARRQAREMGIDLTEVEGTGTDGRVTVDDVKKIAQTMEDGAAQQAQGTAGQAAGQAQEAAGQATGQAGQVAGQADGGAEEMDAQIVASDAAKREAKERGIDLSKVKGTGAEGRIVYWDVVDPASEAEGGADPAGQAAQQAQDAANQAAGQAQEAAGQATDQAGQVAGQAQQAVGGLTGGGQGGGSPLGGVTDQVGQAAGQAQDTAGQAAGQAQDTVGQATDQAGQAQDTAGQATEQAQQAAGQATGGDEAEEPKATNAARRKANEMGVDLSTIKGTGSEGLITIKDVTGS